MRWKHSPKHSARTRFSAPSEKPIYASSTEEICDENVHVPRLGLIDRYSVFAPFIPTTIISTLLLIGSASQWTVPKNLQPMITGNRGSTQLAVQVIATMLGMLHVLVMSTLINYSTRLRLASQRTTSLNRLLFWHSLLSRGLSSELPLHFILVLLVSFGLFTIPAAIWAAAITPISSDQIGYQPLDIPSYSNITMLQAAATYDPRSLPSMATQRGTFSYGVGAILLGPLLNSAATATTIDGSIRQHTKLDQSHFTYHGRSYGIGASIGLLDNHILENRFATRYLFQETGYLPSVSCIYNASTSLILVQESFDTNRTGQSVMFATYGCLPNLSGTADPSNCGGDLYPGFGSGYIVAMETAYDTAAFPYMMGIASGNYYRNLNTTQCTIDFRPTLFNVTVDIRDRNITVIPLNNTPTKVPDMEPNGTLAYTTMEQYRWISASQANMGLSIVGNSFNASIANYMIQHNISDHDTPEAKQATLVGLGNSVAAMVDDILVGFAAAQLMVANVTDVVTAIVIYDALQIGEARYIYIIVALNSILFLVVVAEALRTRGWHGLTDFNYMDPRKLVIGSSRGGRELAEIVDELTAETQGGRAAKIWDKSTSWRVGDLKIKQEGQRIVIGKTVLREWR